MTAAIKIRKPRTAPVIPFGTPSTDSDVPPLLRIPKSRLLGSRPYAFEPQSSATPSASKPYPGEKSALKCDREANTSTAPAKPAIPPETHIAETITRRVAMPANLAAVALAPTACSS